MEPRREAVRIAAISETEGVVAPTLTLRDGLRQMFRVSPRP